MVDDFRKDTEVILRYKNYDEVLNGLDRIYNALWIEDNTGEVVSSYCYAGNAGAVRTLRAFFSGKSVVIKNVEKNAMYYDFTIGISGAGGR